MIHRFGVFEYLRTKTVKSQSKSATFSKLTESMLLLLITMVTDLPLPAFSDQSKRVECLLRREVVHKLAGGNAAYSELQECMVSIVVIFSESDMAANLFMFSRVWSPSVRKLNPVFWMMSLPTWLFLRRVQVLWNLLNSKSKMLHGQNMTLVSLTWAKKRISMH
jgi:hypothetical protein